MKPSRLKMMPAWVTDWAEDRTRAAETLFRKGFTERDGEIYRVSAAAIQRFGLHVDPAETTEPSPEVSDDGPF